MFRFSRLDLPDVHTGLNFSANGESTQWEYTDIKIDASQQSMLDTLTNCNSALIRFEGSSEKIDIDIPSVQIDRLGILQMALRQK